MVDSGSDAFDKELIVSPTPVLVVLAAMSVFLPLIAWQTDEPHQVLRSVVLLYPLLGTTWLLCWWKPQAAGWAATVSLSMAIVLAYPLVRVPSHWVLLALPTALSAALVGLRALPITALGESLTLFLLALVFGRMSPPDLVIALVSVWASAGLMVAAYQPARRLARWSWSYFVDARDLLADARSRQAKLKEALDALAHANRQLAMANDKLAGLRQMAEEAQRTKAAFVAHVSHEFRTPLNIIIGLSEILLDAPRVLGEPLTPGVAQNVAVLYRNCEHLSSMINDVLDLSQVEAGRLALHKEWTNLATLIRGATIVVQPLLVNKGLDLDIVLPDELPLVHCDPVRIRQVILNLASNAARFTDEGGLFIHVKVTERFVTVSVTDTGAGISPEEVERIFEPFQQAGRHMGGWRGGSGLGLAISRDFVQLHDGRMWVESELGVGSTFSFTLPLGESEPPVASAGRWITENWSKRTVPPEMLDATATRSIVLCDGTGELQPICARYGHGIEFTAVDTLAGATRALAQIPAQAVLLNAERTEDVPAMVVEASEAIPDTPIVACTIPKWTTQAIAAGAQGYLLKPCARTDLEHALGLIDGPVRRVLLVDDDEDTQWLMCEMLRAIDADIEVLIASTGDEALDLMRRDAPDIVLLDVILPEMDGWQVLELKTNDESLVRIPVVMISAQDLHDHPLESRFIAATLGKGLSLGKVLRCSGVLANLLAQAD